MDAHAKSIQIYWVVLIITFYNLDQHDAEADNCYPCSLVSLAGPAHLNGE